MDVSPAKRSYFTCANVWWKLLFHSTQISRISKSGVFKGGISPSGLSPLALYADYPFIIRSYAIYKRQGKAPDGAAYINSGYECI